MNLPVELLPWVGFVLILMRTTALCMTAPILGTATVPAPVRLVVASALALAASASAPPPAVVDSVSAFFLAALSETGIGLVAGLLPRFMLQALAGAGSAAGFAVGLGFFANESDPMTGQASGTLERLFSMVGVLVALQLGLHRELAGWLVWSVQVAPPGTAVSLSGLCTAAIAQGIACGVWIVRLGYPVLIAVVSGHLLLGVLGRAAPQLNLQSLGFTAAVLTGGTVVYQTIYPAAHKAVEIARGSLGLL